MPAFRKEKYMKLTKAIKKNLKNWQLYLFLLIPLAYIVVFCYIPMLGAQIAFRDYSVKDGIWGSKWVGLKNIVKFLDSPIFDSLMVNTLSLSLYTLAVSTPLAIIFALILNSLPSARFRKTAQTIVNIPHFISVVVLVGMMMQVFHSRIGLYGITTSFFTGKYPADLFASPSAFRHMYVWSGVWQHFGWNSIIYTAALSGVSLDLHEAAQIDGASRFQRILHVDLPAIRPTITITLILSMGNVMTVGFEKAFLMQNGLNSSASEIISTYVYKIGLNSAIPNFSYSTAIGLFNSVISLILVTLVNRIARRLSETSLW